MIDVLERMKDEGGRMNQRIDSSFRKIRHSLNPGLLEAGAVLAEGFLAPKERDVTAQGDALGKRNALRHQRP
jgi:hypothetical protein